MVFHYWHLAVLAALIALVVWGIRASRQKTLFVLAVVLLAASGFLLYTLVLEEQGLERDLDGWIGDVAFIGVPAIVGVGLGALALRRRA